ncbi:sugar transferase [Haloferula sp.]|uniref:sugar transferase n=1 Tax=Haloferula sp. TaxID=2497595 RepID=UPI003C72A9F5
MKTSPPLEVDDAPHVRPPFLDSSIPRPFSLRHRQRPWVAHQKLVALSFFGDAAVVFMSLLVAYLVRFETGMREVGVHDPAMDLGSYLGHVLIGGVLLQFLLVNFRLHDPRNYLAIRRTIVVILKSCVIWLVAFLGLTLTLKIDPPISRIFCLVGAVFCSATLVGWRWILYCIVRQEGIADALRQKALFVGWNSECQRAMARFNEGRAHRVSVIGAVQGSNSQFDEQPPSDVPVLGDYENIRTILRDSGTDLVMAVDGSLSREDMLELAETCGKEFVDFKLIPSCFQVLVSGLQLESIHGMPVLGIGKLPLHYAFNNAAKRCMDVVGGLLGLIIFAPVMAVFAAAVYLESRGSVVYRQRRIGLNGAPFDILKIRSMKLDAESESGPGWTVKDDPRRLKVGGFMRKWNIDELPQFWNVVKGDMSLVGPRPERPELIEGFKEEIRHYNVRHNVKPGVTGWAQVHGLRGDTCLKERIKFDLDYIENWNFFLDFQIMVMTFFKRKGAC